MHLKIVLAALFLTASISALGQVAPAATKAAGLPLSIGGGFSKTQLDWNGQHMYGPVIWADWTLARVPFKLQGLGVELEVRDTNYDRPISIPRMRQTTFGGGAIYTWRHFRRFSPYGKFLLNYGSIDFTVQDPNYRHDTRTVYTAGGGGEYRTLGNIWLRGEYEYQFWPNLFQGHQTLDPQVITIGAAYKFGHRVQP
jgi:opacity protein-like surface antigen